MKNKTLLTFLFFCISFFACSQKPNMEFYNNVKEFYTLRGIEVNAKTKSELERNIVIYNLSKELNSNKISILAFTSEGNDVPFDIAIIENDTVELYQILAINTILRRIVSLSNKYSNIINNREDIQWIDKILDFHLDAINKSIYNCCVMEVKKGKYTYNIMLNSLKKNE